MATGEEKMDDTPKIISVNISKAKGEPKEPVDSAMLIEDHGLKGDVHAGAEVKQVSLLDDKEIGEMQDRVDIKLRPGDFAENLTTVNLDVNKLKPGKKLAISDEALLEVSQIGKKCHEDCVIKDKTGECIMPTKGVFFRVVRGGTIAPGDRLTIL